MTEAIEKLIEDEETVRKVRDGICPFTGERYDCARCKVKPKREIDAEAVGKPVFIHMCLGIEGYVTGMHEKAMLRNLAASMTLSDGSHPTPTFVLAWMKRLYGLGVTVVPMCKCQRFCFRHGCMGPEAANE